MAEFITDNEITHIETKSEDLVLVGELSDEQIRIACADYEAQIYRPHRDGPDNPCKILIIDDDEDDVGILAEALAKSGVDEVHYVYSGIRAFMYLEETEPDSLPKLIITDHCLPGMTGADFLRDLKKMEKYSHIPVIVLSTTKSPQEVERYRQMGALDYLIKPTSFDEYFKIAAEIKGRLEHV